jgi:hypothetical protein
LSPPNLECSGTARRSCPIDSGRGGNDSSPGGAQAGSAMLTVAIPLLSVNAVPVEGTNLARVESAEKVTSLLLATAPLYP